MKINIKPENVDLFIENVLSLSTTIADCYKSGSGSAFLRNETVMQFIAKMSDLGIELSPIYRGENK